MFNLFNILGLILDIWFRFVKDVKGWFFLVWIMCFVNFGLILGSFFNFLVVVVLRLILLLVFVREVLVFVNLLLYFCCCFLIFFINYDGIFIVVVW